MSVSAISAVGAQVVAQYAAVAPVSKAAEVRRVAPKGDGRKSSSKFSKMGPPRSAEATSSSDVLTVLSGLQTGG